MRDQMLDLLQRLATVRQALGQDAFDAACRSARIALARSVLSDAERRGGKRPPCLIDASLTLRETTDLK